MSGSLKPRGGGGLQIELKKMYLFFYCLSRQSAGFHGILGLPLPFYRLSNIETGESVKK